MDSYTGDELYELILLLDPRPRHRAWNPLKPILEIGTDRWRAKAKAKKILIAAAALSLPLWFIPLAMVALTWNAITTIYGAVATKGKE